MNLKEMIKLLNGDLMNEWTHLRFYLANASLLTGLHCHEYKELFLESAASEMKHVTAFSDLIKGLGGIPTVESHSFFTSNDPVDILWAALQMEEEVVKNYVQRQFDALELSDTDSTNGGWIDVFLDGQIQDSREDADHLKMILAGHTPI